MKLLNLVPRTQTAALLVHALTLTLAFALLAPALRLPWGWAALGPLLAAPALIALRHDGWLAAARATGLGGLFILVAGASWDLWIALLSQQRVDASLHLLLLLLGLALAIMHHLLQALSPPAPEAGRRVSDLLEAALRGPPVLATLCLALLLGGVFLAALYAAQTSLLTPKLLERGVIPPITLNLFLWGMALLGGKWLATALELARAARAPAESLFHRAYRLGGQAGDAQEDFAAALWQQFEAFYTLPRYINWAIPILGFIGTVLGISLATEGLGELLASAETDFSQSLGQALAPLGIAFDTTLVALSLSVVFALCQTLLYRWEERRLLALAEALRRHA